MIKQTPLYGTGEDPPSSEIGVFSLMSLGLSVPIFNKKSHQTQAEECLKLQDPPILLHKLP